MFEMNESPIPIPFPEIGKGMGEDMCMEIDFQRGHSPDGWLAMCDR
jgi:hypothetical protein